MKLLFLGYYHRKYLQPLKNWAKILSKNNFIVNQMYPDRHYKEDIISELIKDYDLIIYFGHGGPHIWYGFNSINTDDLPKVFLGEILQYWLKKLLDLLTT